MRVLVIPDVHLKPWIFSSARQVMRKGRANRVVCLMDIADEWGKEADLDLYRTTYDAAISFAKDYPDTLWCYGNHDICYLWDERESGYSWMAAPIVKEKLQELRQSLKDSDQISFIQRIDNVLFMHGGLCDRFVRNYISDEDYDDVDHVIKTINSFSWAELWQNASPLWFRPQFYMEEMYKSQTLLQVVGHTPVKRIVREGNLISADVFSLKRDGTPYGSQTFVVIDTESWEYEAVI